MRTLRNRNKAKGLTLIELMVSMILMSIVITIVFFIYLTASRAYLRWESKSSFTDCARLILRSLNNSIVNGTRVINAGDSEMTILESNLKESIFGTSATGKLCKNDIALTPGEYLISNLNFKYAIGNEDSMQILEYDELDINNDFDVDEEELAAITGIQYSFVLESKKHQNYYEGIAMLRKF